MVPNSSGNYETCRIPAVWGATNTVSGVVLASDAFQKSDGTARLFVANSTKLYEITASAATDRSAGGGSYTTTAMWHGAQYGDVTIYVSFENDPQASSSGAFAALAGTPPKAKFVATQSLAVALAHYYDGVNTYKDGVWISDIGDHTAWTPGSSNQAANFRLLQTPGEITGLVRFKGDLLAFKGSSFYRISYVGLPVIWQPVLVSDCVGAAGMGTICVCDDAVVFGGQDGWYIYDGVNVQPIAPGRQTERTGTALIGNGYGDFAPGGPYTAFYLNGTTFYWSSEGLALFHPSQGIGGDAPIIAVQLKGEGRAAFGAFCGFLSGVEAQTSFSCLVRGTAPALVAAGVGTDSTWNQVWPGIWATVGGNSTPHTLKTAFSASVGLDAESVAFVQTSFVGDPGVKTLWSAVQPVMGFYSATGQAAAVNCYTAQKTTLDDISMGGAGQFNGTIDPAGVWWTFSHSSRLVSFQITFGGAAELEDLIFNSKPAGLH